MIQITKTEVWGFEAAIRGMRNPLESWDKSDSKFSPDGKFLKIGQEDRRLMKQLSRAGSSHAKYLRFIHVQCDILAPLYWWKEADQYKVGTTTNSCSTMHKIQAHEFTRDMFSHDHMDILSLVTLDKTINDLNLARKLYNDEKEKDDWWQMIQLLPSSFNQLRTYDLNYAVLKNMYHDRKNHKLDEWHVVCDWIKTLPVSDIIIDA